MNQIPVSMDLPLGATKKTFFAHVLIGHVSYLAFSSASFLISVDKALYILDMSRIRLYHM
jgi:hypothetical protein